MQTSSNHISLSQLHSIIKQSLANNLEQTYWVVAEISQMQTNYSGHCYLELIEKEKGRDTLRAKNRATIWASTFRMLAPYFEHSTNQKLQAGLTILIKVSVEFHTLYGLSINVRDIDPIYTLGEQERRKKEIIKQLESENLIEKNAQLSLPNVIQNIAIISSDSAAGYGDFMNQLSNNSYAYDFKTDLYPAVMQGEPARSSIISQLGKIVESRIPYDIILIIRGGGSATDLLCFDDYHLAKCVALCPLPVITGIGHERDSSITDMVAHTDLKTPTAVAEFVIEKSVMFESLLNQYKTDLSSKVQKLLRYEETKLVEYNMLVSRQLHSSIQNMWQKHERLNDALHYSTKRVLTNKNNDLIHLKSKLDHNLTNKINRLKNHHLKLSNEIYKSTSTQIYKLKDKHSSLENTLKMKVATMLNDEQNRLSLMEESMNLYNPTKLLEKGYSLTYVNGKKVKSITDVKEGDIIKTRLIDGEITSKTQ